jgi:hypothetical protein
MTNEERKALKALLAVATQKELALWLRPTDEELERLWEDKIDKQIDAMERLFGDDGDEKALQLPA